MPGMEKKKKKRLWAKTLQGNLFSPQDVTIFLPSPFPQAAVCICLSWWMESLEEWPLGLTQAICNSAGAWIHHHSIGPAVPTKANPWASLLFEHHTTKVALTSVIPVLNSVMQSGSHLEPLSLVSLTNHMQPHPFLFLIVYICKNDLVPVKALERQFRDSKGSSTAYE